MSDEGSSRPVLLPPSINHWTIQSPDNPVVASTKYPTGGQGSEPWPRHPSRPPQLGLEHFQHHTSRLSIEPIPAGKIRGPFIYLFIIEPFICIFMVEETFIWTEIRKKPGRSDHFP